MNTAKPIKPISNTIIATHRLSYTTVIEYDNKIVETQTDAGIDLDAEKLLELIELLNNLPSQPIGLLNNRINSYSISMSSYSVLLKNRTIKVFADCSNGKRQSYFVKRLWPKSINFAFFDDHDEARRWIEEKVEIESLKLASK